jgi:hypothetical protein
VYTLILMKVYGRINKENTRSCTGRFKVTDHAASMVLARHQGSAGNTFPVPHVVTQDASVRNLPEESNTYFTVYSCTLYNKM